MSCVLAGRISAVVAACTVARYVDVIEIRRHPSRRRMAIVTVVATDNMVRIFTGCRHAVMTGPAGSEDIGVIDRRHRIPRCRVVAVLASVGYQNMRRNFAGRVGTVVTIDTIAGDVRVIEDGR